MFIWVQAKYRSLNGRNFVCYVRVMICCFVHHQLLGDVLHYHLGDSGFEDEDFGGAINEEMLQIWVRGLLANNSKSVIDMDKVCDIVKTVICAECQSERSRKPSKRFLRGVRHASSVDFACEPICLNRSPSGDSGWHRSRHERESQQTDVSFFDSGIGLDSDAGICDMSSCDGDEDFFTAGSKDDSCDVDVTCGQFIEPLCVVIIPRRPMDYSRPQRPMDYSSPLQPMDYSRPLQPRDYSRCRRLSLQESPCVGVKQRGKRPSSCSPSVGG